MTALVSCLQAAQIEQVLEAVSQMLVRLEALRIAVPVAGGQYRQFFAWLLRNIRLAEGSAALLTSAPPAAQHQSSGRSHQSPCRPGRSWSGKPSAAHPDLVTYKAGTTPRSLILMCVLDSCCCIHLDEAACTAIP